MSENIVGAGWELVVRSLPRVGDYTWPEGQRLAPVDDWVPAQSGLVLWLGSEQIEELGD